MGNYTLNFTASEINNRLSKLDNMPLSMELVWENASPTSEFASQTVNISDLQNYDMIMFRAKYSTGAYIGFTGFYKTLAETTGCINISASSIANRNFTIKSNAVQFDDGGICSSYGGSATTNNLICIPVEIYGIKGVQ